MAYELWDIQSASLVGKYASEDAAFADVRRWIEGHGAAVTHNLALAYEDSAGKTHPIATGDELASRALKHAQSQNQVLPPAYLEEDLSDLAKSAHPRLVVFTHRMWMEPYHSLEMGELGARLQAARDHAKACELWLRALTLYQQAFTGTFDWGESATEEAVVALNLRADLLGLAGSTSKPTLDALVAGYYWPAFGMTRGLLETWRRAVYVRLEPLEAPKWFELPEASPVGVNGQPRKDRKKSVSYSRIKGAVENRGSEEDKVLLELVNAGFIHMQGGAHPSAEGMTQLRSEQEHRRIFGPTYRRELCAFGLKWGLIAHWCLLREAHLLKAQSPAWIADYNAFYDALGVWQEAYNAALDEKVASGADPA